MAEIEFRLPSKVPYGYVNLRFDEAHVPDPEFLGRMYANYVMAFAEAEREALNAYGKPSEAPSAPRKPDTEEEAEAPPGDAQAAAQRLKDGKKPRTVDEANEMATQLIEKELGATVVGEEKPWNKKAEPKVKPWEKEAAAVASDW